MRILVVEDDADFALVTTETLRFAGHEVAIATTVDAAQQLVERTIPDLAVIDIVLPDGSGLDLCRWIRERYPDVPLILLSSLNRTADILAGFSTGADDYMTKPFHPSELIARVAAQGRRAQRSATVSARPSDPAPARRGISFDHTVRSAFYDGQNIGCTETEYLVLRELAAAPGQLLGYAQLNAKIWNYPDLHDGVLLKGHVSSLRRKLREAGCPDDVIRTVHGVGYTLEVPDASPLADSA